MTVHPDQARWDEKFRRILSREASPEPHNWLRTHLEQFTGEYVIDLACGLAPTLDTLVSLRNGEDPKLLDVKYIGLDVSVVALGRIQERLGAMGVPGSVVQADLESTYPLVGLKGLYVLTYFYSPYLFERVAESAAPGSRVIAETYCVGEDEAPISPKYCLDPGELRSYFSGWDVTLYEERTESHPETARIVADRSE